MKCEAGKGRVCRTMFHTFYVRGGEDVKLKKVLVKAVQKTAMWDVDTACMCWLYQPKQPKALKEKCKKGRTEIGR